MSSISSVAPSSATSSATTSSQTPATPAPLKTIITVVAHGTENHVLGNFNGAQFGRELPDDGATVKPTISQTGHAGFLANLWNNFVKGVEIGVGSVVGSKAAQAAQDIWSKNGSSIVQSLVSNGSKFINYVAQLFEEDPSSPRPSAAQATDATNTASPLSASEEQLAQTIVTQAKDLGIGKALLPALKAVYSALQSSGSIVNASV